MRELKPFKAPTFELAPRRVAEIPIRGNIAGVSDETVAINMISYPFRIIEVKMVFSDDANNWVRHRWLVAKSRNVLAPVTPAGGPPGIDNIFRRESPVAEFSGKAIIRRVPCNIEYPDGMWIIHLYTDNTGPYAYEYNCAVTIEAM